MVKKITSVLLVMSLILSLFTVYSFAAESGAETQATSKYAANYLFYKNSFGDEADDYGTIPALNNAQNSQTEIKTESSGNRYVYFNINDSDKNVYFQLSPNQSYTLGTNNLGYMIFEFDFNDLGNKLNTNKFFEIHSGTGSFQPDGGRIAAANVINFANNGFQNYVYFNGNKLNRINIPSNEWTHIRFEFSILSPDATKYGLKCYVGDKSFETSFDLGDPGVITYIRMGSTNSTNQIFGLDNMAMYVGETNLPSYDSIGKVSGTLMMKVGAENASENGVQFELDNSPMLLNGEIYCPVDAIESFSDKTCPSEYIHKIDNAEYIHIDDINTAFELDSASYEMGLILIGEKKHFLDEDASYSEIMDVMKTFVFNIPTDNELKALVKEHTNNFDHPYLLINQDRFNELKSIYNKGNSNALTNSEDKLLYEYIKSYVNSASNYMSTYCGISPSSTYAGIKSDKIPVNPNYSKYSNNGYDNGGRVSVPTTPLLYFAFAYQMTGNLNYARAAYDFTLALGDWNHWGPDHFLNCADTAAPVAISYDWLYDAYKSLASKGEISKYSNKAYDTEEISTILFTHAIIPGYVQSNNLTCPWPGTANSRYATKTSNWNAVCVSGVVAAALAILEDDISVAGMTFDTQKKVSSGVFTDTVTPIESIGNSSIHLGLSTYSDYAAKLTSMNLGTLAKFGLEQYAPDGSYVESPSYWSYGTNTFFRLVASLLSATGDDFGFMDAWGIDTTCYFAIHSESSDYKTWNFNDGTVGQQDSSFFFFVGDFYGDNELIKVRKKHLATGKSFSLYDILFYDQSVTGEPDLATEYYMVGIDGFSVRSSWDKGAIYAGLIGGLNRVSHGHMDAGSFIYHNNGKIWFQDLGADNYNMGIGYFSNFKLYRVGSEGHNMLSITSEQTTLPYGQSENANPKIVKSLSAENGGYAVLDMSDSYGSHVISGKRGLLFTDSRSTVVIQDEYVFNGKKTAYWYGHYNLANGYVDEVILTADGRTAFMISGDDMIRVSIVSDNDDLKFEIMDCYTYNLDITHKTDRNTMGGAATETNRDSYRKLAIKCENVEKLNLAVVIEEVDDFVTGTSYSWTNIDNWEINSKETSTIDTKLEAEYDNGSMQIGSVSLANKNSGYILDVIDSDKNSYALIIPDSSSKSKKATSLKLIAERNHDIKFTDYRYVVLDFDLFSESELIAGAKLGVNVVKSDGSPSLVSLLSFVSTGFNVSSTSKKLSSSWMHVTLLFDIRDGSCYVYADDVYLSKISGIIKEGDVAFGNFELSLPASAPESSSIQLDEIRIRALTKSYDSAALSSILTKKASLSGWADRISTRIETSPLATAGSEYLYTNKDIESAIQGGKSISLLRDTVGIISVTNPATVNTHGFNFKYKSDSLIATNKNGVLTFATGTVKVKWHIGSSVTEEVYSSSSVATYKGSSPKVGVISYDIVEYSTGGKKYSFYTTGWSNSPGGAALSSSEMIVSQDNCEFWLVNNVPLNCLFATIDSNGKIVGYNTEQQLRTILSSSTGAKTVVLCNDVEIKNTSGLSLSTVGKTLYLNGYTLSHTQTDVHMFNYSGSSTGNFVFVGPGTIKSDGSRTVFTSSSSTSDKTSKYGIVAEHVDILTNTQLADLRVGQHKFIDCYIYQNNPANRSLVDLWNKNTAMSGGAPVNLLTVTFDGCSIVCDHSSGASALSYTSTSYAEYYINNSTFITDGNLINAGTASVKLSVTGSSYIVAGRLSSNDALSFTNVKFDDGAITSINLNSSLLASGCSIVNSYNTSAPYCVSKSYAKVNWLDLNGNVIYSEKAAVGSRPTISSTAVQNYLSQLGSSYTYDTKTISSNADVSLSPVLKSSVTLFHSMSVDEDLSIYIFIEKNEMDNKVSFITVDGIKIMSSAYTLVQANGKTYYRYKLSSVAPSSACNDTLIIIQHKDGSTKKVSISVISYLEALLCTSENEEEKILVVKLLKFIRSAYLYFNEDDAKAIEILSSLIEKYVEYDIFYGNLNSKPTSTAEVRDAISSVRFNLSCTTRIRFILNPSYTGSLKLTFEGKTTTYDVKNGKVNGINYIEVVLFADNICESVSIRSARGEISYGLGEYYYSINNYDPTLQNLMLCLSEYSSAAKQYLETR